MFLFCNCSIASTLADRYLQICVGSSGVSDSVCLQFCKTNWSSIPKIKFLPDLIDKNETSKLVSTILKIRKTIRKQVIRSFLVNKPSSIALYQNYAI